MIRKHISISCLLTVIFLIAVSGFFIFKNKLSMPKKDVQANVKLPSDMEVMVKDFSYVSDEGVINLKIIGKSFTRRGIRFLHVRSNVAKKNYLKDVSGTIRKEGDLISFNAEEGEMEENQIILKKNVKIVTSGASYGCEKARIDFTKGLLIKEDNVNIKLF